MFGQGAELVGRSAPRIDECLAVKVACIRNLVRPLLVLSGPDEAFLLVEDQHDGQRGHENDTGA